MRPHPDAAQMRLLPPTYAVAGLAAAIALDFILPIHLLPAPGFAAWSSWAGMALAAGGLCLGGWTVLVLRRAGTPVEPFKPTTALVAKGPFGFSRNPIYLSMLIIVFGVSLGLSLEWGLLSVPLVWLALDRLAVAPEEIYLRARFGAAYADYLARTRRWL